MLDLTSYPAAMHVAFYDRRRATVYVEGEVDIATAPQLTAILRQALLDECDLTVDFSDVIFFGVSGLNALADALQVAGQLGRQIRVTGAHGTTRRLFEITEFRGLLDPVIAAQRPELRALGEEVAAERS